MKSHKFVDFKLKVLTSHKNEKVSCSTTVLDLHSHLLWMRFTIQFSGCLVILDWSPCSDLAQPLLYSLRTEQQISLCEKMTRPRYTLAGKSFASMTRLKLHSSWLFFRRFMLIWLTHSFLICATLAPFSLVLDIWKVRCWHISRGVIVMYGIYIGSDQIWTWRQ